MERGKFIVFCGGEGSGKTTQVSILADALCAWGKFTLLTKEPGGDRIGRDIRTLLLNPAYHGEMDNRAEFLLFEANRAQHVGKVVRPALEMGKWVISDRFDSDTFAYQYGGRGVCSVEEFARINAFATGGLCPDMYIYVDIDPNIGLARKQKEGVETRFEKETLEFHQKVRAGFKLFVETFAADRSVVIDGAKSITEVSRDIIAALEDMRII